MGHEVQPYRRIILSLVHSLADEACELVAFVLNEVRLDGIIKILQERRIPKAVRRHHVLSDVLYAALHRGAKEAAEGAVCVARAPRGHVR